MNLLRIINSFTDTHKNHNTERNNSFFCTNIPKLVAYLMSTFLPFTS